MKKHSNIVINRRGVSGVLQDLFHGFARHQIWRHFAWDEIQNRYRRSVLGLAWIGLSYLFFVVVIVMFFRNNNNANGGYFLQHVALGYASYTFLVGNISDGCDVFRNSSTWIKSTPLPYSVYIYKSIFRSIFTFCIHIVLAFCVIIYAGWRPTVGALMAIPALGMFLFNAVWIQMLFGLFSTRFHDVSHLVSTVTRLLFFATPILWVIDQRAGLARQIAYANPMTHFIEIFRAPIIGVPILDYSWLIVAGATVVGWIITLLAGSVMLRRLPFWL